APSAGRSSWPDPTRCGSAAGTAPRCRPCFAASPPERACVQTIHDFDQLSSSNTNRTCVQYFRRFQTYRDVLTWDFSAACVQIRPSPAERGDHWGRGIGTLLHAAALARLVLHGFTHAGLWLLDGNQRAERFYHRHGWTETGRTQVDRGPQDIDLHE